jgi:hypothetical protein
MKLLLNLIPLIFLEENNLLINTETKNEEKGASLLESLGFKQKTELYKPKKVYDSNWSDNKREMLARFAQAFPGLVKS